MPYRMLRVTKYDVYKNYIKKSIIYKLCNYLNNVIKKKLELNERIHDMEDMKAVLEKSR